MPENVLFALRRATELSGTNQLDGAFRAHLPVKELRHLGLSSGNFCLLSTEDGKKTGWAIAWPSNDSKDSGKKIIKISDCLKDTYGFSLEDKVSVTKTDRSLAPARSISVSIISKGLEEVAKYEEGELKFWVAHSLARLEAIVIATTLKVEVRLSPKDTRSLLFLIEKVVPESGLDQTRNDRVWPTFFHSGTEVTICAVESSQGSVAKTGGPFNAPQISLEGIGGLQKQILHLNARLRELNDDLRAINLPESVMKQGVGVLLHGPSGTGKSLVLENLADMSLGNVNSLDSLHLLSATQSRARVVEIFSRARKSQPSIILIDNLHKIAGRSDDGGTSSSNLANCLVDEMEKIRGTKVLVVAATSSLTQIDPELRKYSVFSDEIEIPVPDAPSRMEILKILQKNDKTPKDDVTKSIGLRTHGFVGSDLMRLHGIAWSHARQRHIQHRGLEGSTSAGNITNGLGVPEISDTAAGALETLGVDHIVDVLSQEAEVSSAPEIPASQSLEVTLQDFELALKSVRPTAMKEIFLETPSVGWSEIGGSEPIRRALSKAMRHFTRPDLVKALKLQVHRGILLYGPPGCAKTLCAKAVATESGLNFLAVKGAELISKYVGDSELAVRNIFEKARAASPSVIFFDEIDAIASSRSGSEHTPGLNVLTTLLNEMDGIEVLKDVLVLAATNRPDVLDAALLRPGRFDAKIYLGLPNREARTQILAITNKGRPFADDVDEQVLAQRLEGYTGAEIVEVCNRAAGMVADEVEGEVEGGHVRFEIGWRHLDDAMNEVGRGVSQEMITKFVEWQGQGRI